MAASPNTPPVFVLVPDLSCKFPGRSEGQFPYGYKLVFNVTAPVAGTLCIDSVTVPNGTAVILQVQTATGTGTSRCTTIPAGTSQIIVVVGSSDSANGTGIFTGSFNGTEGTFAATFTNFHPCQSL
jgi:hypothetical protein